MRYAWFVAIVVTAMVLIGCSSELSSDRGGVQEPLPVLTEPMASAQPQLSTESSMDQNSTPLLSAGSGPLTQTERCCWLQVYPLYRITEDLGHWRYRYDLHGVIERVWLRRSVGGTHQVRLSSGMALEYLDGRGSEIIASEPAGSVPHDIDYIARITNVPWDGPNVQDFPFQVGRPLSRLTYSCTIYEDGVAVGEAHRVCEGPFIGLLPVIPPPIPMIPPPDFEIDGPYEAVPGPPIP